MARRCITEHGGGTGPPVLLLHGLVGHAEEWEETATHLRPRFSLVAEDSSGWPARIAGIVLFALAATACTRTTAVSEVALLDGATRTLTVSVNTCKASPRAVVVETDRQISITVRSAGQPLGSDDCADSIDIELDEPLGDRRVIDGASGDELTVIGRTD